MRAHLKITAAPILAAVFLVAVPPSIAQLALTPPQVEGPYYPTTKPKEVDGDLTRLGNGPIAKGDVLALTGKVLDPAGNPIENARIEIWQTDARGIYLHPGDLRTADRDKAFQFYGEVRADAAGAFAFQTIFPGPYTGRPRHIHAKITPPGGKTLTTQFYFSGDQDVGRDPIVRRAGAGAQALMLSPTKRADGTVAAEIVLVVNR